ncbi:MAG: protein-L-isoaspartate(D-aspartate) O-methyltransferase [Candidatus Acidiferrales bacterium]
MRASGDAARGAADGSCPATDFESARCEMVERQLRGRSIRSLRVLDAMASVPRHLFVPREHAAEAYSDSPLPIGEGQTISQPYMVAAMADALWLEGGEKILEIGAGSGYQAAVLSLLARNVIAIESQPALAASARDRLARLGYKNVRIESGDGSLGWPVEAPYDAILVTAGAPSIPPPLIEQLAEAGRLVIPVGGARQQELVRVVKRDGRTAEESLFACRFVPLLGRYGWRPDARAHEQGPSRG